MKYIFLLLLIASCSTNPGNRSKEPTLKSAPPKLKNEKPLLNSQVRDFYQATTTTLSPALQDETLDRFNKNELNTITGGDDPLLEVALKCIKGDFKTGFQLASESFFRYQKIAAYWNQIANCHLNAGSQRKALLFYNKALEVSPDYVPALNNIGVMYSRMGQDQKALIAFERAASRGRFSKTPKYNLARLYLTYGLVEIAISHFESLLSDSTGDVDILNALGTAYFMLSDYKKALTYFQLIPQNLWSKSEYGLNISLTFQKLGKKDQAEKIYSLIESPQNENLKRYMLSVKKLIGASE
jgi:tetratricopeptide (TPR) repeat protein